MIVPVRDPQADHHRRRTANTAANGQQRRQPPMPSMTLPTPTPSHIASPRNPTLVQLWLTISLAATTTATPMTTANQHLLKPTPALHFPE